MIRYMPSDSAQTRRFLPYALYGLTGFAGLLAEQGFEKYIALLVGATAAASAVVIFAYFLGFALGSLVAGRLVERGRVRQPLRAYGWIELAVGVSCVLFSLWISSGAGPFGRFPISEPGTCGAVL
jgi:MFS family permease